MKTISNVSLIRILKLYKGDKVGANNTGELRRGCLFPSECLASGECER